MNIVKMLITPDIARKYLEQNTNNRRICKGILYRYIYEMKNGRWKEDTYEMIKISKTGKIIDGQHRLLAVIKANVSIYFHVVLDVEESVFDVLDTGKSRNSFDTFTVSGIKASNTIPSIIALFNSLENGQKLGQQMSSRSTNSELLEQYYENEEFWQNARKKASQWYEAIAKLLTPAWIGGFYAHFSILDKDKAEQFMKELCTGLNITNEIINHLRIKLLHDKMSKHKLTSNFKMAYIIKAWNAYITGNNIKRLVFDPEKENFPVAQKPKNKLF